MRGSRRRGGRRGKQRGCFKGRMILCWCQVCGGGECAHNAAGRDTHPQQKRSCCWPPCKSHQMQPTDLKLLLLPTCLTCASTLCKGVTGWGTYELRHHHTDINNTRQAAIAAEPRVPWRIVPQTRLAREPCQCCGCCNQTQAQFNPLPPSHLYGTFDTLRMLFRMRCCIGSFSSFPAAGPATAIATSTDRVSTP